MIAMEINLAIKITYLQFETRIMHYRNPFETGFRQQSATQNSEMNSSFVE